jgi:ribosome-associated toxin RatA of RatAB toxin-antitoxin module
VSWVFIDGKSTDSPPFTPALRPLCENARADRRVPGEPERLQVVERSAMVTFTAKQMFDLVNDVGRYPEFLPWCSGARVEDTSETERVASVKVARGVLRTEFTTRNTLKRDAQILMHLVDGPFRNLIGEWRFDAIGERGSRVSFRVEFEFKNRLTAAALGAAFESVCSTIVDAFVLRAKKMYTQVQGS